MAYWLVKTEATVYSIDDFAEDKVTQWGGVRNYQARNFMKTMRPGEKVLIYHSEDNPSGVVGMGEVFKAAYPDETQFDKKSAYFDEAATKSAPRWFAPDLKLLRKFKKILPLKALRADRRLTKMMLLQRGSRLSVQPVQEKEFYAILELDAKNR